MYWPLQHTVLFYKGHISFIILSIIPTSKTTVALGNIENATGGSGRLNMCAVGGYKAKPLLPWLSLGALQSIVRSLQDGGHIGSYVSGSLLFLKKDPIRSDWRRGGEERKWWRFRRKAGEGMSERTSVEMGHSPLAKALHRAWAYHE